MPTPRSIAIIGLGTFGAAVARELARFGDHVLGIDTDESAVARLSQELTRAVIADAREPQALEEAGLGSYDIAVVCMATDIEANLLAVMNAKDAGATEVWAKASSSTHARILHQVGVDRVLTPEETFGQQVSQALHNPLMRASVRLTDDLHLAHIGAPKRIWGKTLGKIRFGERHDLRCVGVLRGPVPLPPDPDEQVGENDSLLLVGSRPAMRAFADKA